MYGYVYIYIHIYINIYIYTYARDLIYITYYMLPIDCLLSALAAHDVSQMVSPNGYGHGTKTRNKEHTENLRLLGPWSLVPNPYPLQLHVCASRASNRQSISNIQQVTLLITCYTHTRTLCSTARSVQSQPTV